MSFEQTIWLAVCTALAFVMHAGFAMLETGFTRRKNECNIIMKNVMSFSVGALCYWILGFGLMFGASNGVWGGFHWFSNGNSPVGGVPGSVFLAWEIVFCATSTTIVSGAMAGRTSFSAYLMYSAVMSGIVYPVAGCWIWNPEGWLRQMGFHDFAGGTAVHVLGGMTALIGAAVLGPRIGKYDEHGNPRVIRGQNMPVAALGAFLLWFGWMGFNGGSVVTGSSGFAPALIGKVLVNTMIGSAACSVTAMFLSWKRYAKSDITMTLNGIVAGLVVVTPGADVLAHLSAAILGFLAAFVLVFGIEFVDRVLKVDDPVGAVTVHGLCGAFGSIMLGFFSDRDGALYTGKFGFLGVQALGVLAAASFAVCVMGLLFVLLKHTIGLRVSEQEELRGLSWAEHGWPVTESGGFAPDAASYVGAAAERSGGPGAPHPASVRDTLSGPEKAEVDLTKPTPETYYTSDGKMRKVVILMNSYRFEALKDALDEIDITGMTITNVTGCGVQKGYTEYYRGFSEKSHLLPKVKVEIVISTVPLGLLVDTVKRVLHTGHIGDGKIFVYEVENVIKVRTGEEGIAALE